MDLKFRNVNYAFEYLVAAIYGSETGKAANGIPQISLNLSKKPSRVGEVLQIEEPLLITYQNPRERVLLNAQRDANPFFHVFESLWMLAGRNDLAPLQHYVSTFDNYSDDGKTLNGAYGYRWRHSKCEQSTPFASQKALELGWDTSSAKEVVSVDQIQKIIDHLKQTPNSRRAVLQMWNVEDDLLKISDEPDPPCSQCKGTGLTPKTESIYCKYCSGTGRQRKGVPASKDVCCNTNAYFALRQEPYNAPVGEPDNGVTVLDMTVCNRSNDIILGMLGANVVHFSFLQEYMATKLGVGVGRYYHFTNNAHVYTKGWEPERWIPYLLPSVQTMFDMAPPKYAIKGIPSLSSGIKPSDIVVGGEHFDEEVKQFIDKRDWTRNWKDPFLQYVATPMMWAFECHKKREYPAALMACSLIQANDWQWAATKWIEKRRDLFLARAKSGSKTSYEEADANL